MRTLIAWVVLIFVSQAGAATVVSPARSGSVSSSGLAILGLGANVNFQTATSGRSYQIAAPLGVRAGYAFRIVDVIGEYSYVRSSTGTDMVSIAQSSHEMLLWARKRFELMTSLHPFVALGGGARLQVVSTRFGASTEEESGLDPEVAGAAGLELSITRTLRLSVEGRGTLGGGFSPNPMLGLASYISFLF